MATYDAELFDVASRLLRRPKERGRLSRARIRRSVSTAYYALFHFLLDEIGRLLIGTRSGLLERRRILVRTITHKGVKSTLEKVRGNAVDRSVEDFLRPLGGAAGAVQPPAFAKGFANAFIDAQDKRHEADYDLNEVLSEADARLLVQRAKRCIEAWRAATGDVDRDFKHALCVLMLLKGQLRTE
ncbi:hypothetical protein DFR50_114152 [Roseiarcus fermentans]|uniref:Uncharacterized protein n=1 Tax=Roseiarcus fermentans TaxID=1473586 RepID=A0A366FCC8_9HYPH|nr:hypothetical protein [Roseiarcus fermentans]RBP12322.1 hypothetical protein DFR50_114152 [Roseiarcus fermentans]